MAKFFSKAIMLEHDMKREWINRFDRTQSSLVYKSIYLLTYFTSKLNLLTFAKNLSSFTMCEISGSIVQVISDSVNLPSAKRLNTVWSIEKSAK